jgi:periplasmic copper chaperone A
MRALGMMTLVAAVALSGCQARQGLQVVDASVRLPANPKGPGVGYFTIKGGASEDRLLSVTSPLVIRIEMHDSKMHGGMMKMESLDGGITVPASGEVKFSEGGKHIMLFNINPSLKAGENVQLNFTFASGTILQAFAPVSAFGG